MKEFVEEIDGDGVWSLVVLLIMFRLELGRPILLSELPSLTDIRLPMAHRYPDPGRFRSLIPGCRARERKSVVAEEGGHVRYFPGFHWSFRYS